MTENTDLKSSKVSLKSDKVRYYDSLYYNKKIDNLKFKQEVHDLIKDIYDWKLWTITYHGFANLLAPKLYQFFDILKYKKNWELDFIIDTLEILKKLKLILEKYPEDSFLNYKDLQKWNKEYIKKIYGHGFKTSLDKLIQLIDKLRQLTYQYNEQQKNWETTDLNFFIKWKIEQIKSVSDNIILYLKQRK